MHEKTKSLDMTQGVIWKQLLLFAAPLLVGNLFQQLYNTVDSVVVGNYVGKEALAAVGATANIINTLIGFFLGLATGGGVIISQFFGAKDHKRLSDAVHTSIAMTLVLGIALSVAGVLLAEPMLRLMDTPSDVFDGALIYLRIYFAGALGLMMYNMGAGILRAVGDSRRPLYFLCLSSVLNVGLDLLFVVVFHMGIAGVAWATILSQFISAALLLVVLAHTREPYRLRFRRLRLHRQTLWLILRMGIPAGIQNGIISFSNVFVQSYINHYQSSVMAGWTALMRVDQFVVLPAQSLSLSVTTFAGQNYGAGNPQRAARGTRAGLLTGAAITAVLTVLLNLLKVPIVRIFNSDPDVLHYGTLFISIFSPFYLAICLNQILAGTMRGAGDSRSPMIITLLCYVILRQIYLYVVSRLVENVAWIAFGFPFGWVVCLILMLAYYKSGRWKKHAIYACPEETAPVPASPSASSNAASETSPSGPAPNKS